MKFRKNIEGAVGAKALIVLGVIVVVAVLYLTGVFQAVLVIPGQSEYEEVVVRTSIHTGMIVPISITLTFSQDPRTGQNQADINCLARHKQTKSGGNFVPNPTLVSKASYNTLVGTINDDATIYAVNGNGFKAGVTTADVPVQGIDGVYFGPAQREYKVWNTNPSSMHTPSLGVGSHAILFQMTWKHLVRGTGTELESATVNTNIYYKLPEYNAGSEYQQNYLIQCYVPFSRYVTSEDIRFEIRAYEETGKSIWKEVEITTFREWRWELYLSFWPPGISLKFIKETDTTIETNIRYEWQRPRALPIGKDQYGSHSYLYKIR